MQYVIKQYLIEYDSKLETANLKKQTVKLLQN